MLIHVIGILQPVLASKALRDSSHPSEPGKYAAATTPEPASGANGPYSTADAGTSYDERPRSISTRHWYATATAAGASTGCANAATALPKPAADADRQSNRHTAAYSERSTYAEYDSTWSSKSRTAAVHP